MPGFDDPPQQPSDGGWAMRNLESNLQACQTRLDNYDRLFAGYSELMLSAFDEGYQPTQYSMLMKRGGGWPGIVGGGITPAFTVEDESAGGPDPIISVTAGSVTDLTNSGLVWAGAPATWPNPITINDPVYGPVAFATPVLVGSGPSTRLPQLQLDPAATCVYLNATIDSTTGFITAMEIDGDTGTGVPVSTDTNWYYLLSTVIITITDDVAAVTPNNENPYSKNFKSCGALPLTDGTGYTAGT